MPYKPDYDLIRFGDKDDKLNRKESAYLITNYLLNQDESRVISVNSAWGTGKTWFAHMWKNKLRDEFQEQIIPIYYNAWENDDYEDALIPLVNQVYTQLTYIPGKDEPFDWKTLNEAAGEIFLNIISVPIKTASGGILDVDALIKIIKKSSIKTKEKKKSFFDKQVENYNSVSKAKEEFTKLLQLYAEKNEKIFIFIDELDRCRPTFAIETLERIKHYFGIDNVHFNLLQDSEQLSHSVKVLYGNDCDTDGYLKRFIDLEFSLPKINHKLFFNFIFKKHDTSKGGLTFPVTLPLTA